MEMRRVAGEWRIKSLMQQSARRHPEKPSATIRNARAAAGKKPLRLGGLLTNFPPASDAGVAQLVEHFLAKEDVASSSLVTRSTSFLEENGGKFWFVREVTFCAVAHVAGWETMIGRDFDLESAAPRDDHPEAHGIRNALRDGLHAWRDSIGAALPQPNPDFKGKPKAKP